MAADTVRSFQLGCQILLGNTYHLGLKPGHELVSRAGGLHQFMGWKWAILTDSGGFQMVSLSKLSQVGEAGVLFCSPYTTEQTLLTPEESMRIQNNLGADIIMQLDDVVHVLTQGDRTEEAMNRSIRWLDRCIAAHARPTEQALFPIIQGALDFSLRQRCLAAMIEREQPGYAVGGLSGGEAKEHFWQVVKCCMDRLPDAKPRYVMGVGWPTDLVVCCALGADMFDSVYPTRTARFGTALLAEGELHLTNSRFAHDYTPIERNCPCDTCATYSRAYLHSVASKETALASSAITLHNVSYQTRLLKSIRETISSGQFPEFVKQFFRKRYRTNNGVVGAEIPSWIVDSCATVGIDVRWS